MSNISGSPTPLDFADLITDEILTEWEAEEALPQTHDFTNEDIQSIIQNLPSPPSTLAQITPLPVPSSGDLSSPATPNILPELVTAVVSSIATPDETQFLLLELFYILFKREVATTIMIHAARVGLSLFLRSGIFPGSAEFILNTSWEIRSRGFEDHSERMPPRIAEELLPPVRFFFRVVLIKSNPYFSIFKCSLFSSDQLVDICTISWLRALLNITPYPTWPLKTPYIS